jgi:hypothetical protein
MQKSKAFESILLACALLYAGASPSRAAGCEDTIARHMVEAMLVRSLSPRRKRTA